MQSSTSAPAFSSPAKPQLIPAGLLKAHPTRQSRNISPSSPGFVLPTKPLTTLAPVTTQFVNALLPYVAATKPFVAEPPITEQPVNTLFVALPANIADAAVTFETTQSVNRAFFDSRAKPVPSTVVFRTEQLMKLFVPTGRSTSVTSM